MRLVLKVVITAKSLNLFYSSPVLPRARSIGTESGTGASIAPGGVGRRLELEVYRYERRGHRLL